MIWLYVLVSVIAVSAVSLIGVVTLSLKGVALRKTISVMVSLAVGAFLGDAFIHLIPEALTKSAGAAPLLVIAGILIFFAVEQYFHWHHLHGEEVEDPGVFELERHKVHIHPVGYVVLFSDGLHNFLDGLIIAASYLVSVPVGIATAIAVILHEIPQEIGDFGILVSSGFAKSRALFFNFLSAFTAVAGALIGLALSEASDLFIGWVLPLAAGSFIYVAGSDLIPELHKTRSLRRSLFQLVMIVIGVGLMYSLKFFEP